MSVLSDLDINKLVATERGLLVADESFSGYDYDYRAKYPSTVWVAKQELGNQVEPWEQINFVLCAADSWSIIVENRISVEPFNDEESWYSCGKDELDFEYKDFDSNPLRAAMVCFLKLKHRI
ncbi:phage protein NinX family protein [Vibrio lentus]|uniref:phage protein NinX family protein n=1 Tax=Vibrio lentus TaxID=136468 RepID=UPI000C81DFF5|nr:phage protein NinX family protein [Vibrio lentus]PML25116.1 hypothetical protein BCT80_20340 [Vibrio lentus]